MILVRFARELAYSIHVLVRFFPSNHSSHVPLIYHTKDEETRPGSNFLAGARRSASQHLLLNNLGQVRFSSCIVGAPHSL